MIRAAYNVSENVYVDSYTPSDFNDPTGTSIC